MLHWNQVFELNKFDSFYNILIKNAEELTIYLFFSLLGSAILDQFLTLAHRNISKINLPKLYVHTAERYENEGPDSPQGPFKSR